jgi:TM2 domain-containing membrane protein YozV
MAAPASPTLTPERNGFRYGLLTAAVLCVYTLVAVLAGFFQDITAGALDVLILVAGSVLAIRHFRQVRGDHMPYLGGYGTGIVTSIVASVILGLFFVLMQAVFPSKLDLTQVENLFGFELSTIIALLAIILMGSMTGVMTSLIAMQYFKVQVSDPLQMMKER